MRSKLFLVLLCGLAISGGVYGSNATSIARRAQAADLHVNYRGTKTACVCLNGTTVSSVMKIVHMKPDMTRKEYFSPAALAGIIFIQCGPDAWMYSPRDHAWEQARSACRAYSQYDRDDAFDNYEVQLVGTGMVAGREAYVIRAAPKRPGESLHRVWVDKQCYLMLRTQVETIGGTVLSSSKFTSIAVEPRDISPTIFAVSCKAIPVPAPPRVDFSLRKPFYLPKGYKMVGLAEVTVNAHYCAHLQFSNGVNTISLFERRCDVQTVAPRMPDKLTTVMTWARDGLLFTLVGDISRVELKKIADSVK